MTSEDLDRLAVEPQPQTTRADIEILPPGVIDTSVGEYSVEHDVVLISWQIADELG